MKFTDASKNLQNMKQLDDSWNAQDLATFRRYHTKDCIVRWPNQSPTGISRRSRTKRGGSALPGSICRPLMMLACFAMRI